MTQALAHQSDFDLDANGLRLARSPQMGGATTLFQPVLPQKGR